MNWPKILFVLLIMVASTTGITAQAQQRGGGGRGAQGDGNASQGNPLLLLPLLDRLNRTSVIGGAWWLNTALVTRLGITEEQKANVERAFENHRQNLETAKAALEKEEAQLTQLLEADPFDRNAALTQTYRVIQARSELERENALMSLEMREHLTREQWMQLPQPSVGLTYYTNTPGVRLRIQEGGRGPRGQQ